MQALSKVRFASRRAALIAIAALALAACGGGASGGGGGGTAVRPWTKQVGLTGKAVDVMAMVTDTGGNFYIAGSTTGGLDGNAQNGTKDAFISKYSSAGILQFTKHVGVNNAITTGTSIAIDTGGNIYLAGSTKGVLDTALIGTQDYFLSKFNNIGQLQFTKQFGAATKDTEGNSVAIDTGGNIYVAGTTYGNLGVNTLAGNRDLYFSKHDVTGARLYTTQLGVGGAAATEGNGIAVDSIGNVVYLVGNTSGNLGGVTRTGTFDLFLTKFNSTNGLLVDTKLAGSAGSLSNAIAVTIDPSRNVFVTGWTQGAIGTNTQTGSRDVVLLKYNSTGVSQYVKQLGTAGAGSEGYYIALDAAANVYVAGKTGGGLGGNTVTGSADYFFTKFQASDGTALYTRQLGATGVDTIGRAVAIDPSGNTYVAGYTLGNLDSNTLTGTTDYFIAKYNNAGVKQ